MKNCDDELRLMEKKKKKKKKENKIDVFAVWLLNRV